MRLSDGALLPSCRASKVPEADLLLCSVKANKFFGIPQRNTA
jgi:hypothetical protein